MFCFTKGIGHYLYSDICLGTNCIRACDFFYHYMEMGRVLFFFLVMPCFLLPIYSNYCSFGHAKRLINQRSIKLLSSTFILVPVDLRPIHDCHIHTSTVNAKHISIALFVETHTCFIVFNWKKMYLINFR